MAAEVTPQESVYEAVHFRDDKGPAIVGGSVVLIVVATVAVVLRLVSRRMKRTAWGSDDYTIVLSLVRHDLEAEGRWADFVEIGVCLWDVCLDYIL